MLYPHFVYISTEWLCCWLSNYWCILWLQHHFCSTTLDLRFAELLQMKRIQLQDLQETDTFFQTVKPCIMESWREADREFLVWMSFYRSFQKLPRSQSFRGVSFPSWRYKGLNPAGPAVIELNLLWQTVWAWSRCSAEVSVSAKKPGWCAKREKECLFSTNSISYWLFPLLKYHM